MQGPFVVQNEAIGVALAYLAALLVTHFLATYAFALSVPSMIASFLMAAGTGLVLFPNGRFISGLMQSNFAILLLS